jgi:hypothetical protein
MPAIVLALAAQQRVLLRAADDQASDDVNDFHGEETARNSQAKSAPSGRPLRSVIETLLIFGG